MRSILFVLALTSGLSPIHAGVLLYDNTSIDTFDTIFYSVGPYSALGDQIQLTSAGTATQALVELFNNGTAGTFDVELDFFDVASPVGALLGTFILPGVSSTGGDVLDLSVNLGAGIQLPQNVIFLISIQNQSSSDIDVGVDMFAGPTVGASDSSFIIAASPGPDYFPLPTNNENVYFQLSGNASTTVPETSTLALLGIGLLFFTLYSYLGKSLTRIRVFARGDTAAASPGSAGHFPPALD